MNSLNESQHEQQSSTRQMIDKLLSERQQMLVLFCRVAGLDTFDAKEKKPDLLQDFCQVLVDYAAFGHFEMYDRIASQDGHGNKVKEVAKEVFSRITEASEVAVEFNDKYDAADHELTLDNLHHDLSILGEELAVRIEMEDRVLAAMLA